jgi:hypothetical protein
MITIEISTATLRRLQGHAEPLVDTYDTVIQRLLDAAEASNGPEPPPAPRELEPLRAPKGKKTPNEAFYGPIVKVLREAGGKLPTSEAVDRVGRLMKDTLNDVDRARLKSGEPRWRNTVRWARNDLVRKGTLDPSAPHGVWRLARNGTA